jgi:DNA-binding MarR family transcriptional regulator
MFGRQKRSKVFGPGPSKAMDKNMKARIMVYARAWSANNRSGKQHKGPITRAFMDVLWALLYRCHNSKTGACFPNQKTIALRAGCAVSVVNDAIKVLERAGVLTWVHRLHRVSVKYTNVFGQFVTETQVLRTSNAYTFTDKIGGNPTITENHPVKLEENIINKIERKFDQNDPLEIALRRMKEAMESTGNGGGS